MKMFAAVLLVVLMVGTAMALVGPATYAITVTSPATDTFTVSTSPSRHLVSVYCMSGTIRATARANGANVNLVGGGTEATEYVDIPTGATVPIYGVFDSLVFSSPAGGTAAGYAWQYKE